MAVCFLGIASILLAIVRHVAKVERLVHTLGVVLLIGAATLPALFLIVFSFSLWAFLLFLGWGERKLGWVVEGPADETPEFYRGRPFSSRFCLRIGRGGGLHKVAGDITI